jgi:hypothetical protein
MRCPDNTGRENVPRYSLTVHSSPRGISAKDPYDAVVRLAFALLETSVQGQWRELAPPKEYRKKAKPGYVPLVKPKGRNYTGDLIVHTQDVTKDYEEQMERLRRLREEERQENP